MLEELKATRERFGKTVSLHRGWPFLVGRRVGCLTPIKVDRFAPVRLRCIAIEIQKVRMKTHSSMLHVRMDTEMKRKATVALAAMGLTASEAVRLLFHRIAVDQAFPLELKVPNAKTRGAMAQVDEMVKTRTARFASADEMFAELEEASGQ